MTGASFYIANSIQEYYSQFYPKKTDLVCSMLLDVQKR